MAQQQKLGKKATSVTRNADESLVVRLYSTDIVTVSKSGKITLNTGGYMTNTTKTRMNQAANQFNLGYSVYQKAFDWFVSFNGKNIPFNGSIVTF